MLEEAKIQGISTWVEPFVGGANMIDKVPIEFKRYGFDVNAHLITALIDIRDNTNKLPNELSELDYKKIKGTEVKSIDSWLRFVCSFGGKFDNGYSREKGSDDTTFCGYGKRNALKQSPNIQNVEFICNTFEDLSFKNALIYCDPPYKGTTSYKTNPFPYEVFYDWCRKMKNKGNIIFVSEYSMPEDFKEVWHGEIKTNFASSRTKATHNAIEKLFTI